MKTADEQLDSWQQIGRAAEHFARRVARDAAHFATRIEEHVGALASDIGREWRGPGPARDKGADSAGPADDVRRVFEDVRGVLSAVLEGVDELITTAFAPSRSADEGWSRVIANRDGVCGGCQQPIAAGAEVFARRHAGSHELRCATCGAPGPNAF